MTKITLMVTASILLPMGMFIRDSFPKDCNMAGVFTLMLDLAHTKENGLMEEKRAQENLMLMVTIIKGNGIQQRLALGLTSGKMETDLKAAS